MTRWRTGAALVVAGSIGLALGSVRLAAQHDVEYSVKAEYLFNFIQFTEWPAGAFSAADAPFRICIAGSDPFGPLLDRVVRGEKTEAHPLVVDRVDDDGNFGRCHLVFIGRAETPRAPAILKSIPTAHVLTVGESSDFLRDGGAIAFAVDGGRVRFDVNLGAPHIKSLRVSSKLLRVARTTWRGPDRP